MLQKSQNTCTSARSSKSPKSLGSRGLQIPKPLLEAQIYRKLKTPQNVRSLRILGVDYGKGGLLRKRRAFAHRGSWAHRGSRAQQGSPRQACLEPSQYPLESTGGAPREPPRGFRSDPLCSAAHDDFGPGPRVSSIARGAPAGWHLFFLVKALVSP